MESKPMAGLIEVRLTVDRMRQQILAILPEYADVIRKSIEYEVEAAVRNFNFPEMIRQEAERVLAESVKYATALAIREAMRDPAIQSRINALVAQNLSP